MKLYPLLMGVFLLSGFVMGLYGGDQKQQAGRKIDLRVKCILMVIAHRDFRDEEYQKPRQIFEEAEVKVVTASSSLKPAKGMLGMTVTPDVLLKDARASDFDAVVFVGGLGSMEYWDDAVAHQLVKDAADNGKVVGAICTAPVTLANAGILEGKKATVSSSEVERLHAQGAEYTGHDVEVAGNLVTANGPKASENFGHAILKLLGGK
jgi:protease I